MEWDEMLNWVDDPRKMMVDYWNGVVRRLEIFEFRAVLQCQLLVHSIFRSSRHDSWCLLVRGDLWRCSNNSREILSTVLSMWFLARNPWFLVPGPIIDTWQWCGTTLTYP